MANEPNDFPFRGKINDLLEVITPGYTLTSVLPLMGSYSNDTKLIQARSASGSRVRFILRRYMYGNRSRKARVEFMTLATLQNYDVPVPIPLYVDEVGNDLGSPGIVTRYISGKLLMLPSDHPGGSFRWAQSLAKMLAKIHSVPCDQVKHFVLDANVEATWFLHAGVVPDYMEIHPDGIKVWQAVNKLLPYIQPVEPTLVHLDYWRGNVLWDHGEITAVVDWEEAAYGDPGIDVAYCCMEMVIMGMVKESEEFLRAYEAEMGPVENLEFWQLAAAARPMMDITGWITEPVKGERFHKLITNALRKVNE